MKPSFQMDGVPGLLDAIARYGDKLRVNVIVETTKTRNAVVEHARSLAPKDRGDLARAIQGKGGGLVQFVGLVDEDLPSRGGKNTAHRNPSVYGVWYEFGFVTRKIARHEFMRPAADAEQAAHEAAIIDAINEAAR